MQARAPQLARLVGAGLLVLAGLAVFATGGAFSTAPLRVGGALVVAGLGWAWALGERSTSWSPAVWAWVLVVAVAGRGAALVADAGLSDDLWRYGWEGALVLEGESPYSAAPSARSEHQERWASTYVRLNNVDVSAAYPPVTQAFSAAVVALSVGRAGPVEAALEPAPVAERLELGLRLAFGLVELATVWPLLLLMRRCRAPRGVLLGWLWSPLLMVEFWGSAHFDSLGVLALAWALVGLSARARGVSEDARKIARSSVFGGLALGLAIAVKYLPVLLVPCLGRRVWPVVGLTVVAVMLPVGLLEGGYAGLFTGLSEYGLRWESWNLGYRQVEAALAGALAFDESWSDPRRLGRGLALLVVVGTVLACARRRLPLLDSSYWILGVFLIVSPTLHPWYLAWVLLPLLFSSSATRWAWVHLIVVSPLLYAPLVAWHARGEWLVPGWTAWICGVPFWVLFVVGLVRDRRRCGGSGREVGRALDPSDGLG